jgi:hypothetical protein
LSADRGHDYRCWALTQQLHYTLLGKVFSNDSSPMNSVNTEYRLLESKTSAECCGCGSRADNVSPIILELLLNELRYRVLGRHLVLIHGGTGL